MVCNMSIKSGSLNQMTRKNIFFTWLFGSLLLMLVTAIVSMLVWNFTVEPNQVIAGHPIDYFSGMVLQVPVGWLFSFMTPFGWVSLLFLALSIFTNRFYLLVGSAIATLLSGIFWPMTYVTMMTL